MEGQYVVHIHFSKIVHREIGLVVLHELLQEIIRHEEGHYTPIIFALSLGDMGSLLDEYAGPFVEDPLLIILMKYAFPADHIGDVIAFDEVLFGFRRLRTIVVGKEHPFAIELLRQVGIILQGFVYINHCSQIIRTFRLHSF